MAENRISIIKIEPKELTFKPGGSPVPFEVTVRNDSDRYASFQLEIVADYDKSSQSSDWYSISPEVSTKNPPGDITRFQVAIKDTPVPGFVGRMNLTVRAFFIELPDEDREVLLLNLKQGGSVPLKVELPVKEFQNYPGEEINIPIKVYNPGQSLTNAVIRILGLEPTWLVDGAQQNLSLFPDQEKEIVFSCQIPIAIQAPSKIYPFKIEAKHSQSSTTYVEGTIEVLPQGFLDFDCDPKSAQIPPTELQLRQRLAFWRSDPVIYELQFNNASNLQQQVTAEIAGEHAQQCTFSIAPENTELDELEETAQPTLTIAPENAELNELEETAQSTLTIAPENAELNPGETTQLSLENSMSATLDR